MTESPSKPVFAYWSYRGVATPARMLLAYFGIDYEDKRYTPNLAGVKEWDKIKGGLGLDFPNLPYWKEGPDSPGITESRAIVKHLARTRGNGLLMPSDPDVLTMAETIEGLCYDVAFLLVKRCFNDAEPFIQDMQKTAPQKLEQIEKFLGTKRWILGEQIFYPDFLLYELLYHYNAYDPHFLTPYPGLLKFKGRIEALPQIREYMASSKYISGPCYHPFFVRYKI